MSAARRHSAASPCGVNMPNMRWLVFLSLILGTASVLAAPQVLHSGSRQVSLLELYTSEGCSSCPPADRWLSKLTSDTRLWREVVPVAFHVDYWDYLGWPDRFASSVFGTRQRQYAQNGFIRTVYTPGLILNGKEWRGWFQRPQLRLDHGAEVGQLSLRLENGQVEARFTANGNQPARLDIHLALLGFGLSSQVQAGENRGRMLQHDFVVLAYQQIPCMVRMRIIGHS
ncbi:MAG: DUF1223 domain-containing protein [Candidatus Competibacteraceae bacterium]|nr:DUF1223 domain-containing protein [Candidatus Competibacteraceae bacterium]